MMSGALARPYSADLVTERKKSEKSRGSLVKRIRPSDEEIIKRVEEIAKKRGWTMAQVALAWSLTKVTSPIIGATSVR